MEKKAMKNGNLRARVVVSSKTMIYIYIIDIYNMVNKYIYICLVVTTKLITEGATTLYEFNEI